LRGEPDERAACGSHEIAARYVAGAIARLCEVRIKRRVGIAGRAEQVTQQEAAGDEEHDEQRSRHGHAKLPRSAVCPTHRYVTPAPSTFVDQSGCVNCPSAS